MRRTAQGLPTLDPLVYKGPNEKEMLDRLGLIRLENGKLAEEGRRVTHAIRKHLRDFVAIIALAAIAIGCAAYILDPAAVPDPVHRGGAVRAEGGARATPRA